MLLLLQSSSWPHSARRRHSPYYLRAEAPDPTEAAAARLSRPVLSQCPGPLSPLSRKRAGVGYERILTFILRLLKTAQFTHCIAVLLNQLIVRGMPSEHFTQGPKLISFEPFCEDVGHLQAGADTNQLNFTSKALIPEPKVVLSDVLCTLVMYRILRNLTAGLIVCRGMGTASLQLHSVSQCTR